MTGDSEHSRLRGTPPVALLNTSSATEDGTYKLRTVTADQARALIAARELLSAIGHDATAQILTTLLGADVPVNRIQFAQQPGQVALVFKLRGRAPEGGRPRPRAGRGDRVRPQDPGAGVVMGWAPGPCSTAPVVYAAGPGPSGVWAAVIPPAVTRDADLVFAGISDPDWWSWGVYEKRSGFVYHGIAASRDEAADEAERALLA